MKKILQIFTLPTGEQPFSKWLKKIKDQVIRIRIRARLDRLIEGHYGDCKSLGKGLYELRLCFGSGYRIYFLETSDSIILLLCGGDKCSQIKDIEKARIYQRYTMEGKKHE